MSSQKGNIQRTRPQKHKNRTAFKNDVHGKTPIRKFINSIQVTHVCAKCKLIIEWKIKYKKYKPITAPKKCTKCEEKTVRHAYHIMCGPCANNLKVCPKCGRNEEIVDTSLPLKEQISQDIGMQHTIKRLSERKRRTFLRYIEKIVQNGRTKGDVESEPEEEITLDTVKAKLASLIKGEHDSDDEDDEFGDEFGDESEGESEEESDDDCSRSSLGDSGSENDDQALPVEKQMIEDAEIQKAIKQLSFCKREKFLKFMQEERNDLTQGTLEEEPGHELTLADVRAKLASLRVEEES